jgi:hypothetical protein
MSATLDVFATHRAIIADYKNYIESFVHIKDERIRKEVEEQLASGKLWPEPLIQFNPFFERTGPIEVLVPRMALHPGLAAAFSGYSRRRPRSNWPVFCNVGGRYPACRKRPLPRSPPRRKGTTSSRALPMPIC